MRGILALAAGACLLAGGASAAEPVAGRGVTLTFKDGGSISGILSDIDEQSVTLEVPGGEMGWDLDDIQRIVPADSKYEKFLIDWNRAGNDPDKLTALAKRAKAHGWLTDYDALADELGLPEEPRPAIPEEEEEGPIEAPAPSPEKAAPAPEEPTAPTIGYGPPGTLYVPMPGFGGLAFGQLDPIPSTSTIPPHERGRAHHDEKGDGGSENKVNSKP